MILSTAYFPNILYMSHIVSCENDIMIEAWENYQKQSYRNRFQIASDKGTHTLTMPVHAYNNIPVKDVTVDYSMPWQREHLRTVKTYYASAPYYPYAIDKIEDLFSIREKYLLDYNMLILRRILQILGIDRNIGFTETFQPLTENDPRIITSRNYKCPDTSVTYYQVFSEKQDFIPNLSIIDYIMCEGFDFTV